MIISAIVRGRNLPFLLMLQANANSCVLITLHGAVQLQLEVLTEWRARSGCHSFFFFSQIRHLHMLITLSRLLVVNAIRIRFLRVFSPLGVSACCRWCMFSICQDLTYQQMLDLADLHNIKTVKARTPDWTGKIRHQPKPTVEFYLNKAASSQKCWQRKRRAAQLCAT